MGRGKANRQHWWELLHRSRWPFVGKGRFGNAASDDAQKFLLVLVRCVCARFVTKEEETTASRHRGPRKPHLVQNPADLRRGAQNNASLERKTTRHDPIQIWGAPTMQSFQARRASQASASSLYAYEWRPGSRSPGPSGVESDVRMVRQPV